jgi:hypothetical protein
MNPTIGAALIAIVGVVIGGGLTYIGSRFVATRTIEADQRVRIWEKRSEAYTDAVAGILQLVKVRYSHLQHMTAGTKPENPPASMDSSLMEARLIAYASDPVLEALEKAKLHGNRFDAAFNMWLAAYAQQHSVTPLPPGVDPQTAQRVGDPMKAAKEALPETIMLCNKLMNIIRKELYAGPGRMQAPRDEDLTPMARGDVAPDHLHTDTKVLDHGSDFG